MASGFVCHDPREDRTELWVANVDGSNKVKIATSESISTGFWAADNFRLSFVEEAAGPHDKLYLVRCADGSGLRKLHWSGGSTQNVLRSEDQKSYSCNSVEKGAKAASIWRESAGWFAC